MSDLTPEPKQQPVPTFASGRRTPLFVLGALLLAAVLAFALPSTSLLANEAEDGAAAEETAEADERAPVILYMTSWCPWCRKTRELLTELDVPFEEIDIESSQEGRAEYDKKSKSGGGVPLIDIDGTLVRGFKEDRIRELVADLDEA